MGLLPKRGRHVPIPSQSELPLSGNGKTKVLNCVNWQGWLSMLQNISEWPPGSSQVCMLAFQEMIKDSTWLHCFFLPVHSNVIQSSLLQHEAPQSLLLKSCIPGVNIGAITTYERKTNAVYFCIKPSVKKWRRLSLLSKYRKPIVETI